jgi:rhodanese-related sulfurtransferase
MRYRNIYRLLAPLAIMGAMAACSDNKIVEPEPPAPPSVDEAQVLLQYLETGRSYSIHGNFVVGAAAVRTTMLASPGKQYIIDMRAQADFDRGHIPGSVRVDIGNVIDHLKAMSPAPSSFERIIINCYTGQTAAYAVGVLRALGYTNAFSLKWGMSSWNDDLATPWLNNRSNARATQFVSGPSPAMNPHGDLPKLSTGRNVGSEIAEARARELLSAGLTPATINHNTLFANLDGYYIINFWPANLYQTPGHIPGAVLYEVAANPFESGNALKTLSTTRPNVIYCYTGQTSAYLTGYLRLLGYDARSLMYGANGMIYDLMTQHKVPNQFVPATEIMNYEYSKM